VQGRLAMGEGRPEGVQTQAVAREQRERAQGHRGAIVWFTGLPGAGKTTIAIALELELFRRGARSYRLDGDNLRTGLNSDLGFSSTARAENIRRAGEVAALLADAGMITLACFISPDAQARSRVRASAGSIPFLEVFVDCPLQECELRDPKGLYRQARAGIISDFTGVSAPYESPLAPDLRIESHVVSVGDAVSAVLAALQAKRVLS